MKSDKKPGYVKDDFFDSLSTGPLGPWKPKISEQRKLDMEVQLHDFFKDLQCFFFVIFQHFLDLVLKHLGITKCTKGVTVAKRRGLVVVQRSILTEEKMVIQGEVGLILLRVMSHRKLDGMLANTVYIHLELCTGDFSFP